MSSPASPGDPREHAPLFERFAPHFASAIEQAWAEAIHTLLFDAWWSEGEHARTYAAVERLSWPHASPALAWFAALDHDTARSSEKQALAERRRSAPVDTPVRHHADASFERYATIDALLAARADPQLRGGVDLCWLAHVVAALDGDGEPLAALIGDDGALRSYATFALREPPNAWRESVLAHAAKIEEWLDEGLGMNDSYTVPLWAARRFEGRPVVGKDALDSLDRARTQAATFARRFHTYGDPDTAPEDRRRVPQLLAGARGQSRPHLAPLLQTLHRCGARGEVALVTDAVARLESQLGPLLQLRDQTSVVEALAFCPGRASQLPTSDQRDDEPARSIRRALVAMALARDGDPLAAGSLARDLLAAPVGSLPYEAVGWLTPIALASTHDARARLDAVAADTLARLANA